MKRPVWAITGPHTLLSTSPDHFGNLSTAENVHENHNDDAQIANGISAHIQPCKLWKSKWWKCDGIPSKKYSPGTKASYPTALLVI